MGLSYYEALATPNFIMEQDLQMISLQYKYSQRPNTEDNDKL
jgi:hypothetical protein